MRKLRFLTVSIILLLSLSLAGSLFAVSARPLALGVSPTLGAVASYSILGHTTVTNAGITNVQGDLGVDAGPVSDLGTLTVGPPGTIHTSDVPAGNAQVDNTAAFGFLNQLCDTDWSGTGLVELGGMSLVPGVYCADSFQVTGTLILTGGAGGVYIFKAESTLVAASGAVVRGGDPCNIWWRIGSSATIGTNASFIGSIHALTDIQLQNGATLMGRALVQTGAVTLDANTVSTPVCLVKPKPKPTEEEEELPALVVTGLPDTGGAPIRTGFPWGLAIIGGFGTLALVFGIRAYHRTDLPK